MRAGSLTVSLRTRSGSDPLHVGDVRLRWLLPGLLGLSAIALVGLLYLTSYKDFFYDEWDFVSTYRPSQSGTSIFMPHGEHWSTIPILIWKALFVVFGLRTHIPYEAVVVVAHVACVLLLFVLVRRRSGDLPAFAAALILLLLGTGANDIVLAFQGNQTLSLAFGLLALLLVDTTPLTLRLWHFAALAGLLLCSLMSSGLGLGFVVAVAVQLLLDRGRRRLLLAVLATLGVYLVWFAAVGAGGSACDGCPSAMGAVRSLDPGYLLDVGRFIVIGLSASIVGLLGLILFSLPIPIVLTILLAFFGLMTWHWHEQKGLESWEIGLVAGLLAQLMLIAVTRARLGLTGAADSHYVYIGVLYLLPLVANGFKRVSWRPAVRPALVGCVAIILLSNAALLAQAALIQQDLMQTENAELRVVELYRGAPDMALDRPLDPDVMPQLTAARYYAAIDELGSPVPASVPTSLEKLPAQAVDRQMVSLFGGGLSVTASSGRAASGPCRTLDATAASTLDTEVSSSQTIMLEAGQGGDVALSLGLFLPPSPVPVSQVRIGAGIPQWVHMPDTGRPQVWRLRIKAASLGALEVCGAGSLQFHTGTSALSAEAAGGKLDPGWRTVVDPGAYGGLAAEVPAGTRTTTWKDDFFGTPMVAPAGAFDVWFRMKAASTTGSASEISLGLFDTTAWTWVGGSRYSPSQAGSTYRWVRAATGAVPIPGDQLAFVSEFNSHRPATTDWFVDEAVMLPAGAPPPSDVAP